MTTKLRTILYQRDINQTELAELMQSHGKKPDSSYLNKLVNGRVYNPSAKILVQISLALGVSVEEIIEKDRLIESLKETKQ